MTSVFSKVAPMIIDAEGDVVNNDSDDYGGETKFGISKQEYPDLDIVNLTEEKALEILQRDYWERYHLGLIEDQGIANQIFFLIINMNPIHAVQCVQIAINVCGRNDVKTKLDGVLGSKTIEAINAVSNSWFSNRIRIEAINYYLHITDIDPTQRKFFRGWVRRALRQ